MSALVKADDYVGGLPEVFQLAKSLLQAGSFLPAHLKKEGEVVAVVLAGRELGLPPMASIRGIKLVKGNVTLDASLQLALMVRAGCKVKWLKDGSDGEAILRLERAGQEPHESKFTLADAKRAGLTGDNWSKYPAAMLRARCVTTAGKAYVPDALAGVYLPDELPSDEPAPVRAVMTAEQRMDEIAARGGEQTPLADGSSTNGRIRNSSNGEPGDEPKASASRSTPAHRSGEGSTGSSVAARGGERAETRPTEAATTTTTAKGAGLAGETGATSAKQSSTPGGATAAEQPSNTASASSSNDGELLDAKAWRARYETVCEGAWQFSNIIFGSEDEHGLPIPPFDVPVISAKAKRHAGKTYEEMEPGFLREVIIANEGFAEQPLAKQLWALYLVTRHELAKESKNV